MVRKGIIARGLVLASLACLFCNAFASGGSAPGATGVASVDPALPRPPGTPCVVTLFRNDAFTDFSHHPFSYAPPVGCGTHWSKVVLEADFSVSAGRQFDRTASVWLDGVNLYFGTTAEPSATVAPSWHVERDLTDYTALFRHAGRGQAVLGNIVNDTYTGVIHGSARLLFYPASILAPPGQVPDAVYRLGSDPVGGTVALADAGSQLARTLSLPRNVERAYLDVLVQSQNADEFWYTCVPDRYANEVQSCAGGSFREAEVSIDGEPAGVAPIYPWIYTGGIDPYLWRPVSGVQTLNFIPCRVDLSPFAGKLSNGAPHTVAVSVAGAANYFSATASLLVYLDPHASQVTGAVTRNTLAGQPPVPAVGDTLATDASGNVSGDISTRLSRQFVIEGYANTSHGRVDTTVRQTVAFASTQHFTLDAATYRQQIDQLTSMEGTSTSRIGHFVTSQYSQHLSYPLHLDYHQRMTAAGGTDVTTIVHQGYQQKVAQRFAGLTLYRASLDDTVDSSDTLHYGSDGNFSGHDGQQGKQAFVFRDSLGSCYRDHVASAAGVVTGERRGQDCPGGYNHVEWFAHPDGSPGYGRSLLGW